MGGSMGLALWFAGGGAFFAGAALIVAAAVPKGLSSRKAARIASRMGMLVGVILVALSGTPLPWWAYVVWGVPVGLFLIEPDVAGKRSLTGQSAWRWLRSPRSRGSSPINSRRACPLPGARVVVLGDSISAGVNGDIATWPQVLRKHAGCEVVDLSEAGLTMSRAVPKLEKLAPGGQTVILLEIGGNDMLERMSSHEFARHLAELLSLASAPGRTVILMELPLPPFFNNYGRVQRTLAARYGAALVPRRRFAAILAHSGGTLDGLHLSAKGHELMAEMVGEVVKTSP